MWSSYSVWNFLCWQNIWLKKTIYVILYEWVIYVGLYDIIHAPTSCCYQTLVLIHKTHIHTPLGLGTLTSVNMGVADAPVPTQWHGRNLLLISFAIKWRFSSLQYMQCKSLIARFMGPTWGPPGADNTQVGLMLAPWTLLSGIWFLSVLITCLQLSSSKHNILKDNVTYDTTMTIMGHRSDYG